MRAKKITKKKQLLTLVSFIFCAAIGFWLLPGSIMGSCRINDISLEKVDNFTKLTIYADQPFEFVHSTVKEKDAKPHRVVIDCKDAIHNLPQHNFKKDLPPGTIKAIRTSQFQTEPERIVRIVVDMDKPVIYKLVEKGEEKRGAIAMLTAQEPNFPLWTAAKDEKGGSKTKQVLSSFVEKAIEAKDNIWASSENVSRFDSEQLENAKGEERFFDSQKLSLRKTLPRHSDKEEYVQKESLSSQKEAISSAGEVEKTAKELPEESKTDSVNPTAKEGGVALLNPQEESTKEKPGAPESLVVISKPEGTVLEEKPQRKIIYYHGEGKRDPFAPLTERIGTELGEIPLPTFESLKLVGILKDEAGNRALLEDQRGYGYIMKNGDKIKNGYVVSVEDKKVIFQIQEYGWSKTMALEFSNRISKTR